MKKILLIAGCVFLLLLTAVGALIGFMLFQGRGMDASSKKYVDENLPRVLTTWSKDELLKMASPELQKVINTNPAQMDQLFAKLSKLGKLKHYNGAKGEAKLAYFNAGKTITAEYSATASFEHGDANIRVRLLQSSGHWQFSYFWVGSPIFLQ